MRQTLSPTSGTKARTNVDSDLLVTPVLTPSSPDPGSCCHALVSGPGEGTHGASGERGLVGVGPGHFSESEHNSDSRTPRLRLSPSCFWLLHPVTVSLVSCSLWSPSPACPHPGGGMGGKGGSEPASPSRERQNQIRQGPSSFLIGVDAGPDYRRVIGP